MATCSHVKPDGERCAVVVGDGHDLCLWHDPGRSEQATAARAKGAAAANARRGKNGVRVADPAELPGELNSLEDAARYGSWLVRAVATGALDARTAGEASRALRVFTDAQKHASRVDERVRDLQKQLQKLRDAAGRAR